MKLAARFPRLAAIWRRYWFHLSALMVLVPLAFLKSYIDFQAMMLSAAEADLRSVPVAVGPWTLTLQEPSTEEPYWHPGEGFEKQFRVVPCKKCATEMRAIFITLKRPGSTDYGDEASGNPYRFFAEMKIGRNPRPDDLVWITAEGWDGATHQAKLPLSTASPVTAAWVERGAAGSLP